MNKGSMLIFLILPLLCLIGSCNIINPPGTKEHLVLECSGSVGECKYRVLDNNLINCKKWYDECTETKEGLEDVTYVTASPNYILSPFTKELFNVEVFNVDLFYPWDLEFLPDGSMIISEQSGSVYLINNDVKVLISIKTINLFMSGLMGLAVDPDFEANKYIYLSYTYEYDNNPKFSQVPRPDFRRVLNRISRFTLKEDILTDEFVIINEIPGSLRHVGSRLEFGPDGKLYVTTGDAEELELSQDPAFLGGKILRLNKDGSIPSDNPIPGSYVYSMGHRNPQGLAWHPTSNTLYNSEHGPFRYDEINIISPGKNYGWGSYKCNKVNDKKINPNGKIEFPIICYDKWTMAPSGIEFVRDPISPWYKSLFVAGLKGKHLHRYEFDDKGNVTTDEIFFVSEGKEYVYMEDGREKLRKISNISHRIRDVEYFNGSIYILGNPRGLVKITPQ